MQKMLPYLDYPLSKFLEIESFVKEYYGIDRYAITDIVMQSVDLKELKKYMETTPDRPRYDVDCAFRLIDSIKFNLYDTCKDKEVVKLCETYNIAPGSFAYNVLIFMSLVPSVNSDFTMWVAEDAIQMWVAEDANQDFMEYAVAVRPEMLKLYIALHQLNKDRSFHKSCYIRFGEKEEVEVDKVVPWFQMEIERYLEKYLGVQNLKEAELEYLNVY